MLAETMNERFQFVIVENIRLVRPLDLTADFESNKRKVDTKLPAAREEQTWFPSLSVHSKPDSCVNLDGRD